ncbi:MAG: hypothetical protein RB292_03065 [Patescibacteria group bacterium]|jgi:hypothetical protein|nr:hypothetical protein [Patescibacteria group bacterium]
MDSRIDSINSAIEEITRLAKYLKGRKTVQVKTLEEKQVIASTVYAWINKHRKLFTQSSGSADLDNIDQLYLSVLSLSEQSATRKKYSDILKLLKKALISFREHIISNVIVNPVYTMPEFSSLVEDQKMQSILKKRWDEINRCLQNEASLSATIMMGGTLEALLLARINKLSNKDPIFKLKSTPKDGKTKKAKNLSDWTLNDYINVCAEMGWITEPARQVSQILRDYRNIIHPEKEYRSGINIDTSDAQLFYQIFSQLTEQIVKTKNDGITN